MSSNSSGSVLLAGNVNTERRRRGRRPPEEDANQDSTSSSLGLGVSAGAVSDCVGWRRAESTHVEHLPVPEVVITDDEEEEEGCSFMTEDATVYRTALSGSPPSSSGKTSFKTAEDTVKRSSGGDCATPVAEDSSSLLSVRTGFSAKLLFSVGKRKSLLPRAMAQRTVLAGDSGEEDDESRDTVPDLDARGNPRRKSADKSRAGRRRSILGRNEVILISSESDEDSDGGAGASMEEQRSPEAKVESWIAKSPLGSPGVHRGADAAETGSFFQDDDDDDDDDKSFSPQSERTSKRSFQVRTLTFVESSEEDEDYDSRRSHRSEDTSKNFSRRSKDNSKSNGSSEATSGNFDKSAQASFEDDSTTLSEEEAETSAPLEKSTQASFADTSAEESETPRRSERDVADESIAEENVSTGERDSPSPEPTTTSVRRGRRCSSSSEEGDLEDYFKKLRIMREQARAAEEKEEEEEEEEPMENFIVDDSDLSEEEDGSEEEEDQGNNFISDEAEESDKTDESSGTETEEEDEECEEGNDSSDKENDVSTENSSPRTSPPKREKTPLVVDLTDDLSQDENADIKEDEELPDLDTPKGRKNPPPRRKPPPPKKPAVVPRTPLRPANLNGAADKATLSFLESLSLVRADDGCHPLAKKYVTRFRANRDDLTAKLYRLYNEEIFHGALDPEMTIEWSNRLLTTAGLCHQKTRRFGKDSSKVQCTLFA